MASNVVRLIGQHPVLSVRGGQADGVPMRLLGELSNVDCNTACPEDLIHVFGHVNAAFGVLTPPVPELSPYDPNDAANPAFIAAPLSSALPVKLRVSSCHLPGGYWIDSDRQIVLPGPKVSVQIYAPDGWLDRGGPAPGFEDAWLVNIYACGRVARCCWPPLPRLTEFQHFEPDDIVTWARPRGARALLISATAVGQTWEILSGSLVIGQYLALPGEELWIPLVGAWTHLRNLAFGAALDVTFVWEIGP